MLSYQHIYHAGNFADVHKHAILAQVIAALRAKPAAMGALDTHAGRGLYDLTSEEAGKNNEYRNGIGHVWAQRAAAPAVLKPYLDAVAAYNADGVLSRYPGSTMILRDMLRAGDRLTSVERHPGEFDALRQSMAGRAATVLKQDDGFKFMTTAVPLPERRGIVVIDPSYEIKSEYADLPKYLLKAWKAWMQGTYVVWYPVMDAGGHRVMLSEILKSGIRDVLVSEIRLDVPPQAHFRMTGAGMAIVNPPWPENILRDITRAVTSVLPTKTFGEVFWLDNCHIDPETGLFAP